MKSANFSVERVAKFKCPEGKRQGFFRDGKTPGLGVRVTAAGAKTYIFETRLRSRTMRLTIGDERTWTIAAAQREATRLKTLTDQGLDPRKIKAEQEAAERAERRKIEGDSILIGEAYQAYITHHRDRWGARHLEMHKAFSHAGGQPKKKRGGTGVTAPGILLPILQMRLKELSAPILTEWLKKEAKRAPGSARICVLLFRTFWLWCASRPEYKPLIDAGLLLDKDFREAIPGKRDKRFDVLERAHLKPWFAAVKGLTNPTISTFLQALLLTGARRDEMASLRWEHVDFQWKHIWVKDKVSDQGRKIPLTPYLLELLKALPRKSPWVFYSGTAERGYIREPRKAHMRALKSAGIKHVSVHGLRRSFSSLAEWLEMPRGVIAQLMGHAPNATAERHYINRPLELLAVWHNQYEAWILQEAGIKFGKKRPRTRRPRPGTKARSHLRLVSSR